MKKIIIFYILLIIANVLNINFCNAQNISKVRTVCIDAGHGGKDPGAIGKIVYEKKLTLAIALKVGKYIEENIKDVKVVYTRQNDVFIGLKERAEFANQQNADVFISIHINTCANKKIYGASTYVNALNHSQDNIEIQMMENSVAKLEDNYSAKYKDFYDDDAKYVLSNLVQNINLEQSITLASLVQKQFGTRAGRKDLGVKQASFMVLWNTTMPSILIECGFLTNLNEEKYMSTDEGQNIIASAIYRAFKEYKIRTENTSNGSLSNTNQITNNNNKIITNTNSNSNNSNSNSNNNSNNSTNSKNNSQNSNIDNKVYYLVQVKSSSEKIPLNSKVFKGLKVEEIKIENSYKYYAGKTSDYQKALEMQKEIRKTIPDAFVFAIKNGKKISIQEATKK